MESEEQNLLEEQPMNGCEKRLENDDNDDDLQSNGNDESLLIVNCADECQQNHKEIKENNVPRRSDEPTELSFEKYPENHEEKAKRIKIEQALNDRNKILKDWQELAISEYGLVADDLRRKVWPLLVGIDPNSVEPAPSLDELKTHPEYNQVILDVNRSLKRFPPGIPYEQRIALQDQLTVLILRVIIKYPHLKYYQGYHDVAVTFLLVVGDEIAFHVMEILSTNHLVECMQETMEPTQRRLLFLYPIIQHEQQALHDYLEKSTVGTLFALPWYLTWFGHSLNSYRDVVRLYDYFLAAPLYLPLYVTAAIVLYRQDEIFREDCDMASMHCLLSRLPDDLPFEYLLDYADRLYKQYPPDMIENDVEEILIKEQQQRKLNEEQMAERRRQIQRKSSGSSASIIAKIMPQSIVLRRSVYVTTLSIFVGICAYYYRTHFLTAGIS